MLSIGTTGVTLDTEIVSNEREDDGVGGMAPEARRQGNGSITIRGKEGNQTIISPYIPLRISV